MLSEDDQKMISEILGSTRHPIGGARFGGINAHSAASINPKPPELTDTDHKVLAIWDSLPAGEVLSSTQIGERLYGSGGRTQQAYARPGGKAAWRLVHKGFLARASNSDKADGFTRLRTAADVKSILEPHEKA